jgi:hypothetical protein
LWVKEIRAEETELDVVTVEAVDLLYDLCLEPASVSSQSHEIERAQLTGNYCRALL